MQMLTARLGGLYHVVSPEHLSKYDFGIRIAQRFGFDASLDRTQSACKIWHGVRRVR
jgi:dTDP-4-dehydrorhamnose reductase